MLKKLIFACLLAFFTVGGLDAQIPLTVNMSSTAPCNYDGTATASVTGGTPPYTYQWYYNGNQSLTTTVNTIGGIAGGWVNVYVTDAGAGWGQGNVVLNFPFDLTTNSTPATCTQADGTASITITSGGTPPFTYLWANGATTSSISNLPTGGYDCTITDGAGCGYAISDYDSSGIYVGQSTPISVSGTTTPTSCLSGTATVTPLGGTPPYTYVWNTNPIQITQTATGLAAGGYVVHILDALGCPGWYYSNVAQSGVAFSVNVASTPENCISANGTATMAPFGGAAPYNYIWNNGATTSTITGLVSGTYTCTITDANGCPVVKWANVASVSPVSVIVNATPVSCGMINGTATANPSGGVGPYTYLWGNGQTTQVITGLGAGYYWVNVTDANGCTDHSWAQCILNANCYADITGRVVQDHNGDCVENGSDFGLPNVPIYVPSAAWTNTNSSGNYSAHVPIGTYTVDIPWLVIPYTQNCPVGPINVNASSNSVFPGNNFFLEPNSITQDMEVFMYSSQMSPGFNHNSTVYWHNQGTVGVNATLTVVHDLAVNFLFSSNATPASYTPGTGTIVFNIGLVLPNSSGEIYLYYDCPVGTVIGTPYTHTATLDPIAGDITPFNNVAVNNGIVTGSFDPNDKQVYPSGMLDTEADSILTYTIRFQNTGNDTAYTVMVSDTLDSDLNPATFRLGGTSHPCTLNLSGNCVVEFTFNNIMLPDSNVNEPASHGYIVYSIMPNQPIAMGTEIDNAAAIYFDYNVPVITNTAHSVYSPDAIEKPNGSFAFGMFPNPASDLVTLKFESQLGALAIVKVHNLVGQLVYDSGEWTGNGATEHSIHLSNAGMGQGVYLVSVQSGNATSTQRLVVVK